MLAPREKLCVGLLVQDQDAHTKERRLGGRSPRCREGRAATRLRIAC